MAYVKISYDYIQRSLSENISDVYKLAEFDRVILNLAIEQLRNLEAKLNKDHFIDNPQLTARNTRVSLEKAREHDALRSRFEIINNQCVVLLVSLFASAIAETYRMSILIYALTNQSEKLNAEELKFTVGEVVDDDFRAKERIGHMMAEKKDVSFQDMKSIGRAFREFFEIEIAKDEVVNNIIMAQAGRHVIVHDGAEINERLRKQVSGASPRTLMPDIPYSGRLQFSTDDLHTIGESMLSYYEELSSKVKYVIENDA